MNPVLNAALKGNEQEEGDNKVRHEVVQYLMKELDKELYKVL